MKFLILSKFKPVPTRDPKMAIVINEGAKAWLKKQVASGKLDCVYHVLANGAGYYGMGIATCDSLEDVQALLASYPAYIVTDFEALPLSDVNKALDNVINAMRNMAG